MRVFIKTDEENWIIAINSEIFISDLTGWTEIDSGDGDKYAHAQVHYLPKPLADDNGSYRYKYIDGAVIERTADEIAADNPAAADDPAAEKAPAETVKDAAGTQLVMSIKQYLSDDELNNADADTQLVTSIEQCISAIENAVNELNNNNINTEIVISAENVTEENTEAQSRVSMEQCLSAIENIINEPVENIANTQICVLINRSHSDNNSAKDGTITQLIITIKPCEMSSTDTGDVDAQPYISVEQRLSATENAIEEIICLLMEG